jgi:outer membrane protein assembly factor BamA
MGRAPKIADDGSHVIAALEPAALPRALGILLVALVAALAPAPASLAAKSARLELQGWPLASRDAESSFAPALHAPGDSLALAAALARAEMRLQSGGWLDARLAARWASDSTRLVLSAEPGERYRWGALSLAVPPGDSTQLASLLRWPRGEPADPAQLSVVVERALTAAESQGHAWAQLAVTGWEPDSDRVDVRLSGVLGPQVTISAVRIDGLKVTRRDVAERALGRLTGQPYDPAAARGAAARLAQLGVFSRAEYTGLEGGAQWQTGTLAYRVEEPRYNRFEGAAGVQSDRSLVGLANLQLGNLLGTARATTLGWQSRGPGRSDFRAQYTEPFVFGLPFRFEAGLHQELQDSTYTRTQWGAKLGYALGTGDRIDVGLEEEHVVQPSGPVSNADLQNTVFSYERDGRDDLVSPRRGTRVQTTGTGVWKAETLRPTRPGAGAETQHSNAGVADLRAETHRRVRPSTGLTLELRGTGRFSSQRVLSDYERTPVGGATTLRGHDEEEFRVDRVALSRLEYRWFPSESGERVSVFWDHALMFTREAVTDSAGNVIGDHGLTQSADGIGVGLRLRTAGGLVDVDYGVAPGRGFLDGRIHLRLVSVF